MDINEFLAQRNEQSQDEKALDMAEEQLQIEKEMREAEENGTAWWDVNYSHQRSDGSWVPCETEEEHDARVDELASKSEFSRIQELEQEQVSFDNRWGR